MIDGQLEERNLGELEHSEVQLAVAAWVHGHAREWSIKVLPEMRIRVSERRDRVADVTVLSLQAPREKIITTPPLLVVEVLSPEDRRPRYEQRLHDYRQMGVTNIWVVDSVTREGFNCSSGDWEPTSTFRIARSPIHLAIADLELPA